MTIATGAAKQVRYKKEAAWSVVPANGGGQQLRRLSSNLDLKKTTFSSKELRPDNQVADVRHGVRSADGTISGELSVGAYADFMASICRQAWQDKATTGAIITCNAAANNPQFFRTAGSFLTDGFKVGDVVRWSGWLAPANTNNGNNFYITALTATTMSGFFLNGSSVVIRNAGDSVTCSTVGKKTWIPSTGQVNDSYVIEHWFSDIAQSELFTGCRVADMDIKLPASGFATIDINFMGRDMVPAQAPFFMYPNAVTNGGSLAAVNGMLVVNGLPVGLISALNIKLSAGMTAGEAAGQNTRVDIFMGNLTVSGQMTVYFQDAVMRDIFVNETECSLQGVFTTSNSASADFIAITLPRIKCGGATKDDGQKGLLQTMPFTALNNIYGGTNLSSLVTTVSFQDSTQ